MKTKFLPVLALLLGLSTIATVAAEPAIKEEKKAAIEHRHKAKNEVLNVAPDVKIRVGDNKNAALSDLKVGTVVHIAYTEADGVRLAHHIADVLPTAAEVKNGAGPKPRKGEKHMHAVLESVDSGTKTITVRTERRK